MKNILSFAIKSNKNMSNVLELLPQVESCRVKHEVGEDSKVERTNIFLQIDKLRLSFVFLIETRKNIIGIAEVWSR